jgi:tetratricopeptide (TPR) repeat protein
MRDKLMDKRSIFLPAAAQCKLFAAFGLLLLLAACAVTPQETEQEAVPDAEPETELETAAPEDPFAGADPEVMFHIMAAERLIGIGEYRDALDQYLEAALIADDEELARQVARLAGRLGEWETAIIGAERWLELEPDSRDARQIRILAWLNTGQTEQAVDGLVDLLEGHESQSEGWRRVTVLMAAAEDEAQAVETMSRLVDRTGRDALEPDVLHLQSVLYWQIGDPERALELARAAAEGSGTRRHRVWVAQLSAESDQLENALKWYRTARADEPDHTPLALAEAEVLRRLEREDEAVELLRSITPDDDVLYTLGLYLLSMERIEEAEEVWFELADYDGTEDPLHHAYLTARLAELVEFESEAMKWYLQVDAGPNRERAKIRRAVLEARDDNLPAARELLREVRDSDDFGLVEQTWLIEAELLRDAGQAGEAVDVLGRALRESPNNIRLLYARGINAVHADDLELAEQDFRRIIQIDRDNSMALNALGYTLTDRTDRHQEAYRLIRRALELEPDEPAILDSMGWVYFRMGNPERALPFLERALEGEDNPEIAAHVIEVLWVLERRDEALELRDRAVAEWPDDDYLVDTLKRLGLGE